MSKTALMTSVIDALQHRIDSEESLARRLGARARSLRARVWQIGLPRGAATGGALLAEQTPPWPPRPVRLRKPWLPRNRPQRRLTGTTTSQGSAPTSRSSCVTLARMFRAVVVLVDDLDRCLTDAVVETFEAIRLFLLVEKTAYVIAADQRLVQAAVEVRYPAARESGESIGRNYLEKIIQVTVAIPPLSEPEVETYLALLLAQLELADADFQRLVAGAKAQRAGGALAVAMNEGIAREILGELPENLVEAFTLARQVAPTLAAGLRGNPRQLKRFMNSFVLRRRTAERRRVDLKAGVLAKLMVLEELAFPRFEQLFNWQLEQDGQPQQLAAAEGAVRSPGAPADLSDDAKSWVEEPLTRAASQRGCAATLVSSSAS